MYNSEKRSLEIFTELDNKLGGSSERMTYAKSNDYTGYLKGDKEQSAITKQVAREVYQEVQSKLEAISDDGSLFDVIDSKLQENENPLLSEEFPQAAVVLRRFFAQRLKPTEVEE